MINEQKRANIIIIFSITLTFLVVGLFFYYFLDYKISSAESRFNRELATLKEEILNKEASFRQKELKYLEQIAKQDNGIERRGYQVIEMDENFNTYIDYDLGFKINYPKDNITETTSKKVNVIKDRDVVLISNGYYEDAFYSKEGSVFDIAKGIPFAIVVQEANNNEELEKFIQNRYSEECRLGKQKESKKEGLFEVFIDRGEVDPDDTENCFINYITVIRYSPEHGKVAAWDIGQAVNFINNDKALDSVISDSFEFIK